MSVCDLTDLPVEMCSHCRGLDGRPERTPVMFTISARFSSEAACGHRVHEGDPLGRTADGEWICGRCIEDES